MKGAMVTMMMGLTALSVGRIIGSDGPYQRLVLTVQPGFVAPRTDPEAIPESEYVRVNEQGTLEWRGARVRFWGMVGSLPNLPDRNPAKNVGRNFYQENEAFIRRLEELGFNLNRMWHPRGEDTFTNYTPGDGSPADVLDHFIATAKARGFRFWLAGFGAARTRGLVRAEDAGIVDDPATEAAWRAAIGEGIPMAKLHRARVWDRRLRALGLRQMKRVADHYNHYTGLRVADDPVYVAFELSNEEWWIRAMLRGDWRNLPAFFRNSLIEQWNAFLRRKYERTEFLKQAWDGLLPGESLEQGSIAFAPMASPLPFDVGINDASRAVIEAASGGAPMEIAREKVSPKRAADVLEFLVELLVTHKREEAATVRTWGKALQLVPLAWDTGIGYEIQSQFLHQQAGVSVHDAYVNGRYGGREMAPPPADADELVRLQHRLAASRTTNNRGPWMSWLELPPGICQGVPWLEHNKIEGRPFFCYETQIQQPAKYRADFPLRLLALSSIQDWDIVVWHYWGGVPDIGTNPRPFDKAMDVTTGHHPQGYHFTYDAVQSAMMRAAGLAFRRFAFEAAKRPTKFVYGRRALHDPESMRYAGSYGMLGMAMLPTTYQYGVRIEIDPTRDEDTVIGPYLSGADYFTHNPYTPTPQITFDWQKGFLRMESPAAVIWTGFLARYGKEIRWAGGVVVKEIEIQNDEGIYDPVGPDEQYLAFAMYAEDGKPFDQSSKIAISLVSTSFNTGFRLPDGDGEPVRAGAYPVQYARVGATVEYESLEGMRYVYRDWHNLPIEEGILSGRQLKIPAQKQIWYVELIRP